MYKTLSFKIKNFSFAKLNKTDLGMAPTTMSASKITCGGGRFKQENNAGKKAGT